jgi:hypothetical protein
MILFPLYVLLQAAFVQRGPYKSWLLGKVYHIVKGLNIEAIVIRFLAESTIDLFLWSLIATKYVVRFHRLGARWTDGWTFIFGWAILIVIVATPIYLVKLALGYFYDVKLTQKT